MTCPRSYLFWTSVGFSSTILLILSGIVYDIIVIIIIAIIIIIITIVIIDTIASRCFFILIIKLNFLGWNSLLISLFTYYKVGSAIHHILLFICLV